MKYTKFQNKKIAKRWTLDEIRIAFEKFMTVNGRYPTVLDLDKEAWLPTSRMIQRRFGGMVKLRVLLELDSASDHTRGEHRSKISKMIYDRAKLYEEEFYNHLIALIPEVRVHEHRILRPGGICCDFFIYTDDKHGIVVDLFYAQDFFSASRIILIKAKRYAGITFPIYFVLMENPELSQALIDDLVANKKISLPENIKVLVESEFKKIMPWKQAVVAN